MRYWQFRHSNSFDANNANGLIPTGNEGIAGYLSEDGDITVGLDFIEEGRFLSSVRTDVIDWEQLQVSVAELARFAELVSAASRPISDHRSTADYRRHAVAVLAQRLVRRATGRERAA